MANRMSNMYNTPAEVTQRMVNAAEVAKYRKDNGIRLCANCGSEYSEDAGTCVICECENDAKADYRHFAPDN